MMNITRDIVAVYYATCQICDNKGPKLATIAEAVEAALQEGWEVTNRWVGLQHTSHTACPRCSRTLYEAIHDNAGAESRHETYPTGEEEPDAKNHV